MRIFITGSTGYVGSAVAREFLRAGHQVSALARSERSEREIRRIGASPVEGDLRHPASWLDTAAAHDAVIHVGMEDGAERADSDSRATLAMIEALHRAGGEKRFIYTSVLFILGDREEIATEASHPVPPPHLRWRADLERQVLDAGSEKLRTSVIRPGMVYGGGNGGMVSEFFRQAHTSSAISVVGSGENRWSLVHRDDVASLYRLVVQQGASGTFHAVDGEPLTVRDVADRAAHAAGAATIRSIALDDARGELGNFADALCLDQPAAAPAAARLGWRAAWPAFASSAAAAYAEWKATESS